MPVTYREIFDWKHKWFVFSSSRYCDNDRIMCHWKAWESGQWCMGLLFYIPSVKENCNEVVFSWLKCAYLFHSLSVHVSKRKEFSFSCFNYWSSQYALGDPFKMLASPILDLLSFKAPDLHPTSATHSHRECRPYQQVKPLDNLIPMYPISLFICADDSLWSNSNNSLTLFGSLIH